jgi:uncharacterized protein (TIGR00661 family)
MKILYSIQGTGNGHISRAREIVPLLQQHGEVELLISGTQSDVYLKQAINFNFHGFSFIFGKKGGVDHYKTWKAMDLTGFVRDMRKLPLKSYNLILNDFEPVTAWACKLRNIESVGLSHQASFQSEKVPIPRTGNLGRMILKYYAPSSHAFGFHFAPYDDFISTPVIRSEIRNLVVSSLDHYTVYLPAVDDKGLVPILKKVDSVNWQVFSKHTKIAYQNGNVSVYPVNNEQFNNSLASCQGLLTGGGFEGPSEALFLGKKLLVVPMNFQYEQQCNAFALEQFGLPVIWNKTRNWVPIIKEWVKEEQKHKFNFPDQTAALIEKVVKQFAR